MCCLGLFGVILMIIENEITFRHIHDEKNIYNEKKNPNWVLKIMISVTTVNLVGLVFYYHRLDLNLYAINNSLDNWRVGLTAWKIILILLEALICAIHPFPQSFSSISNIKHDNSTATDTSAPSYIDFDVALGLPSTY
jgi:potassium intermediate/small conductance calcium-activated channel subfamily N protein 3